MGYTKQWISPAVPTGNSATDWKNICQDIHNNMISAGLVWHPVSGHLENFDVWPSNKTYGGFRIYRVNDAQSQAGNHIFIRIDFGTGESGMASSTAISLFVTRSPRFKVQVGISVDGNGVIGDLSSPVQYACPHTFLTSAIGTQATAANTPGACYITSNPD